MDTNSFSLVQSDSDQNRRSREDGKFSSAHTMRGKQRNVHNRVNFDLSSNDGRPSASDRSSRKSPADRSGIRVEVGVSRVMAT